ncbi:MAG: hypothetical protein IPK28_15060 [Devosia sp.]|nr:hypothetical protein [Devosia sp.]
MFTPSGRRIAVEYRVVDADSAIPSNLDDMRTNPRYPADLQPRNRTRAAREVQIARIAGDLQPNAWGPRRRLPMALRSSGPMGLSKAATRGFWPSARPIATVASRRPTIGPTCSRSATTSTGSPSRCSSGYAKPKWGNADRVRFAQEANAGSGLAISASERAASMPPASMAKPSGSTRVVTLAAPRTDFVRSFLAKVADKGRRRRVRHRDGSLSLDGAQRVRGALLRAAYDDGTLVEALLDSGDENIRAFGKVLSDIAGDVARLRDGIKAGRIDPAADASPTLIDAAKFVQDARKRGVSLLHAMAQQDAFNPVSQDTVRVLQYAYGDGMVGRLSRERFETIAKSAIEEAEQQTTDARLFGEASNFSQILEGAGTRYGRQNGASGSVAFGSQPVGPGSGAGWDAGRGPVAGAAGSAGAERGGGSSVLERPALEPNFIPEALGRLSAAQRATRSRAETSTTDAQALRRRAGGGSAPATFPVSAVAPKIFSAGPKSLDAIRAYRNAVGDQQALEALTGYAIDRLRRAALREDGTLDPGKVATWRRQHSDALRAFPELDAQIANAARSSEAMAEAVAVRRATLEAEQDDALGKLSGSMTRATWWPLSVGSSVARMASTR